MLSACQEAASWAIYNLLLHGAQVQPTEDEQDDRYVGIKRKKEKKKKKLPIQVKQCFMGSE